MSKGKKNHDSSEGIQHEKDHRILFSVGESSVGERNEQHQQNTGRKRDVPTRVLLSNSVFYCFNFIVSKMRCAASGAITCSNAFAPK